MADDPTRLSDKPDEDIANGAEAYVSFISIHGLNPDVLKEAIRRLRQRGAGTHIENLERFVRRAYEDIAVLVDSAPLEDKGERRAVLSAIANEVELLRRQRAATEDALMKLRGWLDYDWPATDDLPRLGRSTADIVKQRMVELGLWRDPAEGGEARNDG